MSQGKVFFKIDKKCATSILTVLPEDESFRKSKKRNIYVRGITIYSVFFSLNFSFQISVEHGVRERNMDSPKLPMGRLSLSQALDQILAFPKT